MKYLYLIILLLIVSLVSCDPATPVKINGKKSLTYNFECGDVTVSFRERGVFIVEQEFNIKDTIWVQPRNLKLLNPTDNTEATVFQFFFKNQVIKMEDFDGKPLLLTDKSKISLDLRVEGKNGGIVEMYTKEIQLQANGYIICKDKPLDIPNIKFIYND